MEQQYIFLPWPRQTALCPQRHIQSVMHRMSVAEMTKYCRGCHVFAWNPAYDLQHQYVYERVISGQYTW